MTKIKICGLYREDDIKIINYTNPDYAGFIIDFPKSHRSINYETANKLIKLVNPNIKKVCVFVDKPIDYVLKYQNLCDVIQLHGKEDNNYIDELRINDNKNMIWKAFKIKNSDDLEKARLCNADKILLDNGYGTGKQFDWTVLNDFDKEYILAGGITPENVSKAIKKYNPEVIDVSSGVETNKLKDLEKIQSIISQVKKSGNI